MTRSSKLRKLVERAEELGVDDAVAELVAAYVDGAEKAGEGFEGFHWGETFEGGELVELPPLEPVIWRLGELVEVVYEASKGGRPTHWVHAFEDQRPVLACGQDEKRLYIVGGDYSVTDRGIVG